MILELPAEFAATLPEGDLVHAAVRALLSETPMDEPEKGLHKMILDGVLGG